MTSQIMGGIVGLILFVAGLALLRKSFNIRPDPLVVPTEESGSDVSNAIAFLGILFGGALAFVGATIVVAAIGSFIS